MPLLIGLDLGTTTLTALALDADSGRVRRSVTRPNTCDVTARADRERGRSEWDAAAIAGLALDCLRELADGLDGREIAGLGVTGQQHGVVLIDGRGQPLTPLINWQDKRGDEPMPGASRSWAAAARERVGEEGAARAGCRLSAGYLAVTLLWLANNGGLPAGARACLLMDFVTARLTGAGPTTDPTCAASSGALDVRRRDWDDGALAALGLSRELLPPVVPSGTRLGGLTAETASLTGLPRGLPVFVGVGDNQASFFGSVADRATSVLVNVGTGGQVAAWSADVRQDRQTEARPFFDGYLLVSAGLSGGAAYATLERFFRSVAREVLGIEPPADAYEAMNRLASQVPDGADGLTCEPFFSGTRHEPWLKASWTGLTAANFTPGHLSRALLEGMARSFAASAGRVAGLLGRPPAALIGAGNGVRTNPLLARIIAGAIGLPMRVPAHREEAACGAALLAAVGAGVISNLDEAGRRIVLSEPLALTDDRGDTPPHHHSGG
jgi:sugar (pentulose or hexulose) kinase